MDQDPMPPVHIRLVGIAVVLVFVPSLCMWITGLIATCASALLSPITPISLEGRRIFGISSISLLASLALLRLIIDRYPGHEITPDKDAGFRRIFVLVSVISALALVVMARSWRIFS